MKKRTIMLLSLIVIAIMGCQSYEEPVACTMDAKECPDGSAVGRIGPDCQFAPCPGEELSSPDADDY
ncbi:MAG: hypothetical protein AABX72_03950 [Nanoarchaeota archaeon]